MIPTFGARIEWSGFSYSEESRDPVKLRQTGERGSSAFGMSYHSGMSVEPVQPMWYVTRKITVQECPWLRKDREVGDIVYEFTDTTYGLIKPGGKAFTNDPHGGNPFFELPKDAVSPAPVVKEEDEWEEVTAEQLIHEHIAAEATKILRAENAVAELKVALEDIYLRSPFGSYPLAERYGKIIEAMEADLDICREISIRT